MEVQVLSSAPNLDLPVYIKRLRSLPFTPLLTKYPYQAISHREEAKRAIEQTYVKGQVQATLGQTSVTASGTFPTSTQVILNLPSYEGLTAETVTFAAANLI